jgi:hypothetical protein
MDVDHEDVRRIFLDESLERARPLGADEPE